MTRLSSNKWYRFHIKLTETFLTETFQTQAALTRGEEPLFEFISTYGLSDKPIGTSLSISEIALALQNEIRTRFL